MIKITSKLLSELPEGVFYVDKNLFIRTRNGKQAYQRSDLLEQRRPLMQAWADALTKI